MVFKFTTWAIPETRFALHHSSKSLMKPTILSSPLKVGGFPTYMAGEAIGASTGASGSISGGELPLLSEEGAGEGGEERRLLCGNLEEGVDRLGAWRRA